VGRGEIPLHVHDPRRRPGASVARAPVDASLGLAEQIPEEAKHLSRWAEEVNPTLGSDAEPLVDEGFPRIRGWDWHKVLREEDYPASAEISSDGFDGQTVRETVGAVIALAKLLRPHVNSHL
jgi:hypothetical protein